MKHTKNRKLAQDNRWITVKPNGPDHKGRPVEIDDSGRITKGMGGNLQGEKISEVRKDFMGPKTPGANSKKTDLQLQVEYEEAQYQARKKEEKKTERARERFEKYQKEVIDPRVARARKIAEEMRSRAAEMEQKQAGGQASLPAGQGGKSTGLTPEQWKERERDAIAGLVGKEKRDAQREFYEANKSAITKARSERAKAELDAIRAPDKEIVDLAGKKGLNAFVTANTGFMRGSSYDDIVFVSGNTYEHAELLKAHGAKWNSREKAWMFNGREAARKAFNQLPDVSNVDKYEQKAQMQLRKLSGDAQIALDAGLSGSDDPANYEYLALDVRNPYYSEGTMALDKASVRSIDADGRMHIAISNISKANVCGYYGREIPNADKLGLDAGRMYQLLRDPQELEKAASTFNNVPLLDEHIPVTAEEPQKSKVVGSTGTDAEFDGKYLKNSLVVWDAAAIAGINTGEQKELSAAYRYVADMTPGVYRGVPYDGVMRQIVGNHVALVPVGRAGADVVVGDSLPMEQIPMKIKKGMTGVVNAALCGHILPKLALDAAPIPRIKALVATADTVEKLAQDAAEEFEGAGLDSGDLVKLLRMALAAAEGGKPAEDEDEPDELPQEGGEPDEDEPPTEDEGDEQDAKEKTEELQNGKAEKPAMDAALIAAKAEKQAMAKFTAIRKAERAVAPLVGEVAAMDSADAVYRFAMDSVGINYKGVHPSAYPALIEMHQRAQANVQPVRVAMDAAATSELAKIMPNAFGAKK